MEPWIEFERIDERPPYERHPDWHAVDTITFGELVEGGFIDFDSPEWQWDSYSDDQKRVIEAKIFARYWFREISVLPPLRWKMEFLRKLNEIMPKYKPLYKMLETGVDPLQVENRYGKSRQIYSDFPETMLSANSDYASSGNDREYEDIIEGDVVNRLADFAEKYKDVDVMILDDLETCFSPFFSVQINGW